MNTEQPKQIEDAQAKAWFDYNERRGHFASPVAQEANRQGFEAGYAAARSWVPVEDRLPDEAGMYLATMPRGRSEIIVTDVLWYDGKDWPSFLNPTAWMPLPKPYRKIEPPQPSMEDVK